MRKEERALAVTEQMPKASASKVPQSGRWARRGDDSGGRTTWRPRGKGERKRRLYGVEEKLRGPFPFEPALIL